MLTSLFSLFYITGEFHRAQRSCVYGTLITQKFVLSLLKCDCTFVLMVLF